MSSGRTVLVLIAIGCAPALAGCGFSGNSSVSESTGSSGSALAFSTCMRSHGVPQFPDPGASPGPNFLNIGKSSPAFQSALTTCNKLVPDAGPKGSPAPAPSASDLKTALAWAECVRRHGAPNFPDPSTNAHAGLIFRGIVFPVGLNFNPQTPGFERAQAACGFGPGGGPGPRAGGGPRGG